MDRPIVSDIDLKMMERCVELARTAGRHGEFPFASLVCNGEGIVSEALNRVDRDADVTRHAELVAVSEAQRVLGRNDLSDCTIYSTVEPCAMCSFPIRETRISRVVFALRSPLMGGFSKFGILQDARMSDVMPEFFGDPPEIVGGVLVREVEKAWRNCNPLVWAVIRYRGCFNGNPAGDACVHQHSSGRARRFNWRQIAHRIISKAPRRRGSSVEVPAFEGRPNSQAEQPSVVNARPGGGGD
ncbi:MAG TPA: nucleoside deaminase [Xanthobacteraceae bacterium]|jgi:tRNA(adenine34) deaminase|nr:nucleoside deaminase [Xanthobacteraceae bacterium]